ncbi:hypothetical protein HHK36_008267 [Tetracentron sinense]|uniref:peptidylprolyl isomerase n=1 Tax=Tetracentron sinense TaxID=13715 RepID=A0A835DN16_TETSI|nr:hypothetical protein HHK36_008267 [Tetracentron sinense]
MKESPTYEWSKRYVNGSSGLSNFNESRIRWILWVTYGYKRGLGRDLSKRRKDLPSGKSKFLRRQTNDDALSPENKTKGRDAMNEFPVIALNSVLSIDLELVSFKPVVDITGDSKVLKKILKEGEGTLIPNEGAAVTIRYTAKLEDGVVFEKKGYDGLEPLEFVIDEGQLYLKLFLMCIFFSLKYIEQVISGLDRAAETMKKGELSILTIKPEYGFGSVEVKRDLAIIPPYSGLVYEVEMVDFTKEKAPWEMSNHEKIEAAGKKKEEGNQLFKNGKHQRAAKRYGKAADYISKDGSFGDDDLKLVKELRVSCWLNSAACSLKLNDFWGAIKFCSKVLDIEFHNVKALYRRAQAYMEIADLDLAELDIKKALEMDSQNREVKSVQKRLKQLQAESNKRDVKLYTNMFARMTKDSAMVAKRLKVEKAEDAKKVEEVTAIEVEQVAVNLAPHNSEMVVDPFIAGCSLTSVLGSCLTDVMPVTIDV